MSGSGAGGGGGAGAGEVIRQGHLKKLKTMKKKYFVLRAETAEQSARLEYYESEKKFRSGTIPRRVLSLKSCYNIMRRLDLKQRHVIALFTREEQFCIVADNEQDLHAWLEAILKLHRSDETSVELLHPIQHVWQVNVQKKGLGAVKNIHGLYNLCLTDKALTLVKIKSHNNVISELGIPERIEYSLKNIRRCGDSECFFYMEVGRQTTTGAGELWMLAEDSNIAQSMHSTIYHAMRNCAKETENERDHIVLPKGDGLPPTRRQTYSDGRGRAGLAAEYQQNNPLTDKPEGTRLIKHHRTVSLPTGCPSFPEPLKIVHERTRSAPLTGEEVDRVVEKALHSSCKAVNGTDVPKKSQCVRRASTGMRLSKLSPAHSKNAGTLRNRCDSMPSRACSAYEIERPPPRINDMEGIEVARDEPDAVGEWYRTPRIPEEPDLCDISKDLANVSLSAGAIHQSRTSSTGAEEAETEGYLRMSALEPLEPDAPARLSSSGSVCSGTPSTDPRFSEYQLEPATSHIAEWRPPRAYSVGSRPAPRAEGRHRAYSVGARARPAHHHHHHADDLMLLDFSNNSPNKTATPPISVTPPRARAVDEYVCMSPRAAYVEMRAGEPPAPAPAPAPAPDGYVEMNFGRAQTRPIAIAAPPRTPHPAPVRASPDDRLSCGVTRHGSQIFEFSGSLESPLSPAEPAPAPLPLDDDPPNTIDKLTPQEGGTERTESQPTEAADGDVACSPHYVTLHPLAPANNVTEESNAAVVVAGACAPSGSFTCAPLNYAALDLEPRRLLAPAHPHHYTQIDFHRSEKLHAYDA